jgi:hypothetical protein
MNKPTKIKLRGGKMMITVTYMNDGRRMFFKFPYCPALMKDIKNMKGRQWYGYPEAKLRDYVLEHFRTDKVWGAPVCPRNNWTLAYLMGERPYQHYKEEYYPSTSRFPFEGEFTYQAEMSGFLQARKRCIISGDMGVGKTLALFDAIEHLHPRSIWYVCPNFVRDAVRAEIKKWEPNLGPGFEILTYKEVLKRHRNGYVGTPLPECVIFDESHELKTPSAMQSEAALLTANAMREHWDDPIIWCASGTCAPLDPTDWWHQCEIVCPGYLEEPTIHAFRERMAIMVTEDFGNGPVKKVKQWRDRDRLCDNCGEDKKDHCVTDNDLAAMCGGCTEYVEAKNEVAAFYNRVNNKLVYHCRKSDVLSLPPIRYETVILPPSTEHMDLSRACIALAENPSRAAIDLRTISDGFTIRREEVGRTTCPECAGNGELDQYVPNVDQLPPNPEGMSAEEYQDTYFSLQRMPCPRCEGDGDLPKWKKHIKYFGGPKEAAFRKQLAAFSDLGRLVSVAGFTGSVDLMTKWASEEGWEWIRCDGRGWATSLPLDKKDVNFQDVFQYEQEKYPKILMAGHPSSVGSGLTLHAAHALIIFSNDHNTKNRVQVEARIHRPGMDEEFGGRIIDFYHLPSDKMIHGKLEIKRARMDLSNGLDIDMREIEALFNVK